jgi:hypothetical protein
MLAYEKMPTLYAGEGLREMGRKCWVAMRLEVWDEAEPAGGEVPGRWSVSILEVRGGIHVSTKLESGFPVLVEKESTMHRAVSYQAP